MPFVSPGVFIRELDFSDYAPALSTTILGLLGGGTKGPLNSPTIVTDEATLISKFGRPTLNDYGVFSAIQFLRWGRTLLYTRVAGPSVETADRTIIDGDADTLAVTASLEIQELEATANATNHSGIAGNAITVEILAGLSAAIATGKLNNDIDITAVSGASGNVVINLVGGGTAGSEGVTGAGTVGDPYVIAIEDGVSSQGQVATAIAGIAEVNTAVADVPANIVSLGTDADTITLAGGVDASVLGFSAVGTDVTIQLADGGSTADEIVTAFGGAGASVTDVLTIALKSGGVGATATTPATSANLESGSEATAEEDILLISALTPGSDGNNIQVVLEAGSSGTLFNVRVSAPIDNAGTLGELEAFRDVSLDLSNERYIETVINEGIVGESFASEHIVVEVLLDTTLPNFGTHQLGDVTGGQGTLGADGIDDLAPADYVGTTVGGVSTGMKLFSNPETVDVNLLVVPGVSDGAVISELMAVCAQRGDAMCIVDPPFGLNVDEVIDWHNGVGYGHAAFNSSFGALYWPWIKVLDPYNRKKVWLPPSGFVLGQIAYTDNVTQPWFAPAGLNRGHIIQALEIEYSPTLGERDFLYGNGNAVNPIVNFTRLGIHIWGNRTLQRKPTALDRVNVRRMVLYAEKVISTSIKFLVFEPNDEITWKRFIDLVDPTMEFIRATRGLYDFRVICDESTNPPSQIDQNTMLGKVLVKPTKSAEVIIVDFTLLSTGAEFST